MQNPPGVLVAGNPATTAVEGEAPGEYHCLQMKQSVNADLMSSIPWISRGWKEVDSGTQEFVEKGE